MTMTSKKSCFILNEATMSAEVLAAGLCATPAESQRAERALSFLDQWSHTGDGRRSEVRKHTGTLARILAGAAPSVRPDARELAERVLTLASGRLKALQGGGVGVAAFLEMLGATGLAAGIGGAVAAGDVPRALARRLLGTSRLSLRARLSAGLPVSLPQLDDLCEGHLERAYALWADCGVAPWKRPPTFVEADLAGRVIRATEVMAGLGWRCAHPGCTHGLEGAALCIDHALDLAHGEALAARRGEAAKDEYLLSPLMLGLMRLGQYPELGDACLRPGDTSSREPLALVVCPVHLRDWQQHRPPPRVLFGRLHRSPP